MNPIPRLHLLGISSLAEFDGAISHLFRHTADVHALPRSEPNQYTIRLWDLPTWTEVDVVVDERLCSKSDGSGLLGCQVTSDGELYDAARRPWSGCGQRFSSRATNMKPKPWRRA